MVLGDLRTRVTEFYTFKKNYAICEEIMNIMYTGRAKRGDFVFFITASIKRNIDEL